MHFVFLLKHCLKIRHKHYTESVSQVSSKEDEPEKKSAEDKAREELKDKYERYETNLERVRHWHAYAEARNAAVITLVVAMLGVFWAAIPNVYDFAKEIIANNKDKVWVNLSLNIVLLAFAVGVTVWLLLVLRIALSSYKPQYNKELDEPDNGEGKYPKRSADDNFLYWKTIAKKPYKEYMEKFSRIYGTDGQCNDCKYKPQELSMEVQYSKEIVSNARITSCMYNKFEKAWRCLKKGLFWLIVAVVLIAAYMIVLLVIGKGTNVLTEAMN